ncbi:MAG TPA: SLC13/DASS family transporter [Candidatus Desulfofervidus auxilii]|uniref:SLC13/DASS family transporter n=1 Tax=Desulfofervidus auxilii TaxID=1621989 RepID=A0A7V0IAJ8_DESA2|nr:SLC13/DASS family transporter [Candidatus Desulfofervidus auxilii]
MFKVMQRYTLFQKIIFFLGSILSIFIFLFCDLSPGHPLVTRMASVAVLMAMWWIAEAVPLAVTALLPVVLFPLMGIMESKVVCSYYFNDIIFLFIGGFILALAMQRWGLHKRIGLAIILLIGVSPRRIILGFMGATAFLSMWISNTATTMIMVPIAIALILEMEERFGTESVRQFPIGLLLGIAYAASIGGMATLVGTPPNLVLAKMFSISFPNGPEISFAKWLIFALPVSFIFLIFAWLILIILFSQKKFQFQSDVAVFKKEYKKLGKMSFEEWVVLMVFFLTAMLWLFRKDINIGHFRILGWSSFFPVPNYIRDGTVAMMTTIPLFFIPAREKTFIMDWDTASRLPWGIVLLFGGGFALAAGFKTSGLSSWMGERLTNLAHYHPVLIVIIVCLLISILTELTSNTATAQMALPILASLSVAIKINPLLLMIPATMSASCAFMLPVATPPNAIIFGTQRLRVYDMAKAGIILNIFKILLFIIATFLWSKISFGNLILFPSWAK